MGQGSFIGTLKKEKQSLSEIQNNYNQSDSFLEK